MVIRADDAALEYREEVFSGVAVLVAAKAGELLYAVIDRIVSAELATDTLIDRAFVGHKVGAAVNVGNQQGADVLCVDIGNVEAADMTFTFDQRDNGFLGGGDTVSAVTGLAAHIGFIGFYNAAATAKGVIAGRTVHRFADTVAKEPSGLVGNANHAGHLACAHALLGSGHDMRCQQPFVQRNVAALHNAASADGELVAAIVAKEHASLRLAAHAVNAGRTTVRAIRLTIPTRYFEVCKRLGFVVKDRVGYVGYHGFVPYEAGLAKSVC